ncbi:MAG: L-seryl-tRNA(Sec) selenium transferase [bacterium]|nr:L-seryl-tRNA(Sec) selenium transferase [bacterium]
MKDIPSVEKILLHPLFKPIIKAYSRERVALTIRDFLAFCRILINKEKPVDLSIETIAGEIKKIIKKEDAPSLKRVINASGTIIHTNLGRSILPHSALKAINLAASGAVNLEYNIESGKRGERDSHIEKLICRLTGAEAATVVNNNAAAVLITLNSLAKKKEVIVSRGELVEIGGTFRIPDIIKSSVCKMIEVGTTNRTRLSDYKNAITNKTGALLKVHTSNYKIEGFTETTSLKDLSTLSIPLIEDLGSGAMINLSIYGIPGEPLIKDSLIMGADVVTFSGDKLLGGPQCGIIAGKKEIIKKINRNPLKRALRVDKITIAALEALLLLYMNKETLKENIPSIRHMTRSEDEVSSIAEKAAHSLKQIFKERAIISLEKGFSEPGSGSLPGQKIPTTLVIIKHLTLSPSSLAKMFRKNDPSIIGRIQKDSFILDSRSVDSYLDLIPSI